MVTLIRLRRPPPRRGQRSPHSCPLRCTSSYSPEFIYKRYLSPPSVVMLVPCTANVSVDITALSSAMPSNWVILLSLTASLVLLGAIRLVLSWGSATSAGNSADKTETPLHQQEAKRSTFGIFTWENLPLNLPVALVAPQTQMMGRGVGLAAGAPMSRHSSVPAPSSEMANKPQVNWQPSRGRQSYDQPRTLFQSLSQAA